MSQELCKQNMSVQNISVDCMNGKDDFRLFTTRLKHAFYRDFSFDEFYL